MKKNFYDWSMYDYQYKEEETPEVEESIESKEEVLMLYFGKDSSDFGDLYTEHSSLHFRRDGSYYMNMTFTYSNRYMLSDDKLREFTVEMEVAITLEQWIFINGRILNDNMPMADEIVEKLCPEILPELMIRVKDVPKRTETLKYLKLNKDTDLHCNHVIEGEQYAKLNTFNLELYLWGTDNYFYYRKFKTQEEFEAELDYLHFIANNGGISSLYDLTKLRGYRTYD